MSDPEIQDPAVAAQKSAWTIRRFLFCLLAGVALVLAALLIVFAVARGQRVPELTRPGFDEAWTRWERVEPASYDIETRVKGPQPGVYRVEVRGGQVRSASRNGYPLRQARTMGTWSAPGMFRTIERDLIHREKVAQGRAGPRPVQLLLRARFDPQWGYPVRYERIEWGSQMEVVWDVTHFQIDPDRTADLASGK